MQLQDLNTPAALVDTARMQRNIDRMQQRMNSLAVAFRPHVKTTKCIDIARAQIQAGLLPQDAETDPGGYVEPGYLDEARATLKTQR